MSQYLFINNYFENLYLSGSFFIKFVGGNITHIGDYYKNITFGNTIRSFYKYEESYLIITSSTYTEVGWYEYSDNAKRIYDKSIVTVWCINLKIIFF